MKELEAARYDVKKRKGEFSDLVVFFFQAEDGIRDSSVTGVQTCALPICPYPQPRCRRGISTVRPEICKMYAQRRKRCLHRDRLSCPGGCLHQFTASDRPEIGRASCRERV